jgi:hypothetical protein
MKPFDPPPSDIARAWRLCRELAALLDRIPGERLGLLEDLPPLLEKVVAAGRRRPRARHPVAIAEGGPEAAARGGMKAWHGAPGAPWSKQR